MHHRPPLRKRPEPLRLNHISIDLTGIIVEVLQRVRRSPAYPVLTLHFSDNTIVQVFVDGYDPAHPGIPKQLEMDNGLDILISTNELFNLWVVDCALITLQDTAFDRKHVLPTCENVSWNQKYLALALKFSEQHPRWYCVWARMEEYNECNGTCSIFRDCDDVYIERLYRSPKKTKWRKSPSGLPKGPVS